MSGFTFDTVLACELADAFSASTGLGCTVKCTNSKEPLCTFGYTCQCCSLCSVFHCNEHACELTHL